MLDENRHTRDVLRQTSMNGLRECKQKLEGKTFRPHDSSDTWERRRGKRKEPEERRRGAHGQRHEWMGTA